MKIQGEGQTWAEDFAGQEAQTKNEDITAVLLVDGWHNIVPGSFKLFRTGMKVPFVRFNMETGGLLASSKPYTVELFPNQLHGVAYPAKEDTQTDEYKDECL